MKKLIFLLLMIFLTSATCYTAGAQPFQGKTKHKLTKRLTKSQLRKIQKGKNLYYHEHGKLRKRR